MRRISSLNAPARWFHAPAYAGMAAIADFNNDRYALPDLGDELNTFTTINSGQTITVVSSPIALNKVYQILNAPVGLQWYDGSTLRNLNGAASSYVAVAGTGQFALYQNSGSTLNIAGVSVKEVLTVKLRPATRAEWFSAHTASSTTARTYIDSTGVLKNDLAAHAARFDWSNGKRQLLLENQATNLLLQSDAFEDVIWAKTRTSITVDGAGVRSLVEDTTATSTHIIYRSGISLTASVPYTSAAEVKAAGRSKIRIIAASGTGANGVYAVADLEAGTISNAVAFGTGWTAGTPSIITMADGWYRISVSGTNGAETTGGLFQINLMDGAGAVTYTGDGVSGIQLRRAQFEQSSFASSYIPTGSASVTRAIETFRLPPIVEAILQRDRGGVVVRGQLHTSAAQAVIVGFSGAYNRIAKFGSAQAVTEDAGSALFATAGNGTNAPFGIAKTWDAAGRAITLNNGGVASDAVLQAARTSAHLARCETLGGISYGDGRYDFLGVLADRPDNSRLQQLAVPA